MAGKEQEVMTNEQLETILDMIAMILEGCEDIDAAREKINELRKSARGESKKET